MTAAPSVRLGVEREARRIYVALRGPGASCTLQLDRAAASALVAAIVCALEPDGLDRTEHWLRATLQTRSWQVDDDASKQ